jgi:hypothetical protein
MSYKFSCPVPKEQRPINEYMQLVQSNFFNWPVLEKSLFRKKLVQGFFICFLILGPFSNFFSSITQSPAKFVLINSLFTTVFMLVLILRLLLVWNYIKERLDNPTVFYEESGWYDGRLWIKSKNILLQDRLIRAYQVLPTIKKLTKILGILCGLLGILLFLLLFS